VQRYQLQAAPRISGLSLGGYIVGARIVDIHALILAQSSRQRGDTVTPMQLTPLTGTFGADVRGVDLSAADDTCLDALRAALDEHHVLAVRDQNLEIDTFEAMARRLGAFGETPFITAIDGHPDVLRVLREAHESGPLFGSGWHSDWSFQQRPPSATLLYAVEVPESGGDTAFANGQAAYDALSPAMQDMLGGLNAVHSARRSYGPSGTFGRNDPDAGMDSHGGEEALATQLHPLVRTHAATGRKSLFVNEVYTIGLEGMSRNESAPLLRFLFEHVTQVAFTCRVRWEPGTLTIWDNRVVQHFAIDDYTGHRREMLRITLAGEQPR